MASNRIGFNQFLKSISGEIQLILDTNVIIAFFDEDHRQHDLIKNFLSKLDNKCDPSFYSTVTVKSEFLDFRRRWHLTDGLLDLVDEVSNGRSLITSTKAKINAKKGLLTNRRKQTLNESGLAIEDEGEMEINPSKRLFLDSEIKEIKKSFRAREVQDEYGWIKVCDLYLKEQLTKDESLLDEFCTYLTTRHKDQREKIFQDKEIDWNAATDLCSSTGMGYHDAMILNIFKSSSIPYLVTLDYDLIYGVTIDAPEKTVLLPDNRLSDFKSTLKKAPVRNSKSYCAR